MMPLLYYFILTLVIELPVVIIYFKHQRIRALGIGFLLNLLTWPLLQVLLSESTININILECSVAIIEGIGYLLFLKILKSVKLPHVFPFFYFLKIVALLPLLFLQWVCI